MKINALIFDVIICMFIIISSSSSSFIIVIVYVIIMIIISSSSDIMHVITSKYREAQVPTAYAVISTSRSRSIEKGGGGKAGLLYYSIIYCTIL